ncbi:leucine-rich repeat-containing protein 51-like isoform X2 [Pomacea canaliculata]|uniref:leucine-rich repeat-containing protein 51-like isoform X2 n=1 Tax=Pomacea canaliculata TaxID=400727 RepID=UPI000D7258F2|nr:leucine-rich repeat-containing protein 51-like isoform X2 [Pomacea canaliculata]
MAESDAENLRKRTQENLKNVTQRDAHIVAPLDYSFFGLSTVEDAETLEPRAVEVSKGVSHATSSSKSKGRCLRMNNNSLVDIKGLYNLVTNLFLIPDWIGWIDLSYNQLPIIDPVLLKFEKLEILYLHGNAIKDIKEVNKLEDARSLRKLTLHGNELENEKDYRKKVLAMLPQLRSLDFSPVTKGENITVLCWKKINSPKKKKVIAED